MSKYGSYISDVITRIASTNEFSEEEVNWFAQLMTQVANEHIAEDNPIEGQYIQNPVMKKKGIIASDFSAISLTTQHIFEVKEGEKVLAHDLICEVIGRDFEKGNLLIRHPFWGEKWLPETRVIRLQKIFTMNMMKEVIKTAMSGEFISHFKNKIGQDRVEELEHDETQSKSYQLDDK